MKIRDIIGGGAIIALLGLLGGMYASIKVDEQEIKELNDRVAALEATLSEHKAYNKEIDRLIKLHEFGSEHLE